MCNVIFNLERSKHFNDYPLAVSELSERIVNSLKEDEIFKAEQIVEDVAFLNFSEFFLEKWVNGDSSGEITADEFVFIMKKTIIGSNLISLKNKELIDSIENENGEMVYFLTPAGKSFLNKE